MMRRFILLQFLMFNLFCIRVTAGNRAQGEIYHGYIGDRSYPEYIATISVERDGYSGGSATIRLVVHVLQKNRAYEYRAEVQSFHWQFWNRVSWKRLYGRGIKADRLPNALYVVPGEGRVRIGRKIHKLKGVMPDVMGKLKYFTNPVYLFTKPKGGPMVLMRKVKGHWYGWSSTDGGQVFKPLLNFRWSAAVNRRHIKEPVTGVPAERVLLRASLRFAGDDLRTLDIDFCFSPVNHGSGLMDDKPGFRWTRLSAFTAYAQYRWGSETAWMLSYESQDRWLIIHRGKGFRLYSLDWKTNTGRALLGGEKIRYKEKAHKWLRIQRGTRTLVYRMGK